MGDSVPMQPAASIQIKERTMRKQYLECGKIVNTHGVKGEVKVQPWCDTPEELLELSALYLDRGNRRLAIEHCRVQGNMNLVKFEGIDDMDTAAALRGKVVYLDRGEVEMPEGVYFIQDLFGLSVVDADTGVRYGELSDVSSTGANDVYHITFADGSIKLIPAIPQVVISVDF